MNFWDNFKVKVKKYKEPKYNPFEVDGPAIPKSKNIDIVVADKRFDKAFQDLLERIFASTDVEFDENTLDFLEYASDKDYPNQLLLIYRNHLLGLVYIESDLLYTIMRFNPEHRKFISFP